MNSESVRRHLAKLGLDIPLHFFGECDSTNTRALEIRKSGGHADFLVIAASQSSGRGRFERAWRDEEGKSICLSALFDASGAAPRSLGLFGILAGVCICRALREYSAADLKLKWPNDIYFEDGKLAGMIASLEAGGGRAQSLLFGIGVNFAPLSDRGGLDCKSLSEASQKPLEINEAAAAVAAAACEAFGRAKSGDTGGIEDEFAQIDFLRGREIQVSCAGNVISGTAEGIDAEGRLVLRGASGEILLAGAGESSILKK